MRTPPLSKASTASEPKRALCGQSGYIDRPLAQRVISEKFSELETANAVRYDVNGGKLMREIREQKMFDELGGIDNLLNKVNPIGERRWGLMPDQPYSR